MRKERWRAQRGIGKEKDEGKIESKYQCLRFKREKERQRERWVGSIGCIAKAFSPPWGWCVLREGLFVMCD